MIEVVDATLTVVVVLLPLGVGLAMTDDRGSRRDITSELRDEGDPPRHDR